MEKRGISPLIATVLILGFTVALAAIIMTWGTGFTKKIQEQTEETSSIQITCATDVVFDIKSACEAATDGEYKITIANNGNKKIDGFQIRFYKALDNVLTKNYDFDLNSDGIEAFGIESDTEASGYTGNKEVYQIEVIPKITVGSKSITCAQNIDSFGDVNGANPIDEC